MNKIYKKNGKWIYEYEKGKKITRTSYSKISDEEFEYIKNNFYNTLSKEEIKKELIR